MRSLSCRSNTLHSAGRILLPVLLTVSILFRLEIHQEYNTIANKNYSALDYPLNLTLFFTIKYHQNTHISTCTQTETAKNINGVNGSTPPIIGLSIGHSMVSWRTNGMMKYGFYCRVLPREWQVCKNLHFKMSLSVLPSLNFVHLFLSSDSQNKTKQNKTKPCADSKLTFSDFLLY